MTARRPAGSHVGVELGRRAEQENRHPKRQVVPQVAADLLMRAFGLLGGAFGVQVHVLRVVDRSGPSFSRLHVSSKDLVLTRIVCSVDVGAGTGGFWDAECTMAPADEQAERQDRQSAGRPRRILSRDA